MTERRILAIEKVLGLAKGTQNDVNPLSVEFGDGYGPPRTLLEINFDLAPGYYIYDKTRPPAAGEEPKRKEGDIWIQRFPSEKRILSVPIYMLAEQVAQIMRFLTLPPEFIVELEPAKPYDPAGYVGPFQLTADGTWPPKGPKVAGRAQHAIAFERRAAGQISMLPKPDLQNGVARLDQRRDDRVYRRPETEEWPDEDQLYPTDHEEAMRVEGVGGDAELQFNMQQDAQNEAKAAPVAIVPQSGKSVFVREQGSNKRPRGRSPPRTEQLRPTVADDLDPLGAFEYDKEIMEFYGQSDATTAALSWELPAEGQNFGM